MVSVSVIVPVFQVEKYLEECLHSIRNQSLKNIEIICIDDGSKDQSPLILDRAAAEDARIHVIHNENHGYGYSVNYGFGIASGEYLSIVEPDDILAPDALQVLYDTAQKHDLDLVKGDYCEMHTNPDGSRTLVPTFLHPDTKLYNTVFDVRQCPRALTSLIINCSGIFRRRLIDEYHIRLSETPGASYQDISLFFPLMLRAKRIMFLNVFTYWYRVDNAAASAHNTGKIYLADKEYMKAQDYITAFVPDVRLLCASWAARWRGAIGVFLRIGKESYAEFLKYLRPLFTKADRDGLIRREFFTSFQWALFRSFKKSDEAFTRSFELANNASTKPIRIYWRIRYDGLFETLGFFHRKKKAEESVNKEE
ncbi:MAG: glycosyltransferase [Clostridia bacterium]|nr:glycosyltransferase [Clostridia bacterium]